MNTLLSNTEVLALLNAEYALDTSTRCHFIRRGCNDSWLIGSGNDWYIFRMYLNHKYYIKTADDFRFELDLLNHLHQAGLPVSTAVPNRHNELLGQTETVQAYAHTHCFPTRRVMQSRSKH